MKKTPEKQIDKKISLTRSTSIDLMGRQSVRATFRLSETCIGAISILSAQLGIKQKSVFDHLMEDVQVLKELARTLENMEFNPQERIQKTFVISRRSLSFLDTISSEHNTPRDALVEYSVRRLLPIIVHESKKHKKRKELLVEITNHFKICEKLFSKAENILGPDDLITSRMESVTSFYKNALDGMVNFIDRGKIIEQFQFEPKDDLPPFYEK